MAFRVLPKAHARVPVIEEKESSPPEVRLRSGGAKGSSDGFLDSSSMASVSRDGCPTRPSWDLRRVAHRKRYRRFAPSISTRTRSADRDQRQTQRSDGSLGYLPIPPKVDGVNGSLTFRVRFVQWHGKTYFHCHVRRTRTRHDAKHLDGLTIWALGALK